MLMRSVAAMDSSSASASSSSSSDSPQPAVFLSPGGSLGGHGRRDALEQRFIPASKGQQVVQLLARDGLTGRVLWSRKDTLSNSEYQVAVPAVVGSPGRDGVVLLRSSFSFSNVSDVLTALDGHGRKLWSRQLSQPQSKQSSGGGFSFSGVFTMLEFGAHLRPGAVDIAQTVERSARFRVP